MSALTLAPTLLITILPSCVLSTVIPVPACSWRSIISVPNWLVPKIKAAPGGLGVNASGVSLNALKVILPPCPNTAYNSVKLPFAFLKASLILSPVPSLPSTPK